MSVQNLESVDVFAAGFPCQPFSRAGAQKGTKDARGNMFDYCKNYIAEHTPAAFILENVSTMKTHSKFKPYYDAIMGSLRSLGTHKVYDHVLDTIEQGVPQSRKRLYIVGIRKDFHGFMDFKWPPPVDSLPLSAFLDTKKGKVADLPTTKTHTNNLERVVLRLLDQGVDLTRGTVVVDVNVGLSREPVFAIDRMPCITRSRGAARGYFLVNKRRMTTPGELLRCQGFTEQFVMDGLSDNQVGAMAFKGRKSWPALSDGRTGEGVFGSLPMVLADFDSLWLFSFDFRSFLWFWHVSGRSGGRANGRTGEPAPPEHKPESLRKQRSVDTLRWQCR